MMRSRLNQQSINYIDYVHPKVLISQIVELLMTDSKPPMINTAVI